MINELILQRLNARQREAVETLDGPLLILAGAGSGKTRVLTHRIAALIDTGRCAVQEVLAVTFTNKAAREMHERAFQLLHSLGFPNERQLWISTFHSTCVRILRNHIHLLGYPSSFGIYDSSDTLSLLKRTLKKLNLDEDVHPAKGFQARISSAKMLGLTAEDLAAKNLESFRLDNTALNVYREYEAEMRTSKSLDFDDLLLKTYQLFTDFPEVLNHYQNHFKYIMVDEYQDTNHIQYKLVYMLASKHRNLCVVGDEDQSIYSWRGADISNILTFEKDFPEAKVIKLEQNYRSTKTIVTAASHLIRNNSQRKDKVLFTENASGHPIIIQEEGNEYDEARFVVKSIQQQMRGGSYKYNDFAVFYRTNAQSRVLEEQMRTQSIPYKLVGGLKFYDRLEIKDIIGYMKLAVNPTDNVAFRRVINSPARGIGKTTIEKLTELADQWQMPLLATTQKAAEHRQFHSGVCRKLLAFCNMMEELTNAAQTHTPADHYHLILDRTGYVVRLKEENTNESLARIENLEEFDNAITQFEKERAEKSSIQSFLEEMALVSDLDSVNTNEDTVTLMTLHVSKGLEFPHVYIVGMEEGIFPTTRALDRFAVDALEEERRLAYVGMTRAQEFLTLSYCRNRRLWGSEQHNPPSRFFAELPEELVVQRTNINRPMFMQKYGHRIGSRRSLDGGSETFSESFDDDYNQAQHWNSDPFDGGSKPGAGSQKPLYGSHGRDSGVQNHSRAIKKGCRVRHPTYGTGSVYEMEGSGDSQKVSVLFDDRSIKKFVTKYARLEVL